MVVLTLVLAPVQAVMLRVPGRGKARVARWYWRAVAWLLGVRVRVVGRPVAGRAVVFASNHSSWLDIPVLGGVVEACFVSKAEVGGWPGVGTVARLGRTVFVSRRARRATAERDDMRGRLAAGDSLVLFPEGTSSDGSRVLPFRSTFFSVAEGAAVVQPVSLVYDRLGWLPVGRAARPLFAWYGDMELGRHFWALAQHRGLRATVLFHAPVEPGAFASRKVLAEAVQARVAEGAAALRQNRAVPVRAGEAFA